MGHYFSELWHPLMDPTTNEFWRAERKKELLDLLKENPHKMEDFEIGALVQLWSGLKKVSEVTYPGQRTENTELILHNIPLIVEGLRADYIGVTPLSRALNPELIVHKKTPNGLVLFEETGTYIDMLRCAPYDHRLFEPLR